MCFLSARQALIPLLFLFTMLPVYKSYVKTSAKSSELEGISEVNDIQKALFLFK